MRLWGSQWPVTLLGWALGTALLVGCASWGTIPPTTFQFYNVVPYKAPGEGGWKVAQVRILLTRVSRTQPLQAWCDVEIGLPEVNHQGRVANVAAQELAAFAADEAARFALQQRVATSAALCDAFRLKMGSLLARDIPGAKVNKFMEQGIPQTTFSPE
ncbi:hypothetical protein [Hyalangium rubrum]|uniref:Lipoprotein n=1 Tax=Hyalangium rubrum TaxID=3103134 RepID=A0ABU5HI93_9BACT|nr:hypothetical protein [Hyalangium sp. s54d21]MDY7232966.1 hypothetical protein [Hyalangium sp. s54d21]